MEFERDWRRAAKDAKGASAPAAAAAAAQHAYLSFVGRKTFLALFASGIDATIHSAQLTVTRRC